MARRKKRRGSRRETRWAQYCVDLCIEHTSELGNDSRLRESSSTAEEMGESTGSLGTEADLKDHYVSGQSLRVNPVCHVGMIRGLS